MSKKPTVLMILDGYGLNDNPEGNAIKTAKTPVMDLLYERYPHSKGYASDLRKNTSYTFWTKNFDAMAKKTLIRQLISKWGIMSIEMQRAYEADMGVLDEDGTVRYVDNDSDIVAEVEAEISENSNKEEFVIESPAQIEEKAEPKTVADVVGQQKGKEPVKVEKKEQKQDIPAFMKMKNME